MQYLKEFKIFDIFKKKDNHLLLDEVETILEIVRMFAFDNDMVEDRIWDLTGDPSKDHILKELNFRSRDTNINFFSNNMEFILLEDKLTKHFPDGVEIDPKLSKLLNRIKSYFPHLKYTNKSIDYFSIKITKY